MLHLPATVFEPATTCEPSASAAARHRRAAMPAARGLGRPGARRACTRPPVEETPGPAASESPAAPAVETMPAASAAETHRLGFVLSVAGNTLGGALVLAGALSLPSVFATLVSLLIA